MDLDPALAEVIGSLPGVQGEVTAVEPLTLGITNRNFRVDVGGASFVVRLAGRDTDLLGIDREAENVAASAAAEAGVAPEVVAYLPELGALVTRFVVAEPLEPERLEDDPVLRAVVDAMRAIHGMPPIASTFDAFAVVRGYRTIAAERGVAIPAAYDDALEAAEAIAGALVGASGVDPRPCHNDFLNANLLWLDGRVIVVDYEYAGMGDVFFDLGNFSINNGISEDAQRRLLEHYFGHTTPANLARLQLFRVMSDFREAMWGVVQQAISTLDVDYVEYAERHFTRCLETAADPRFGVWLADAPGEIS
jgi:thiamine kinase-like enzyme